MIVQKDNKAYSYFIFGLRLQCNLKIPRLVECEATSKPDVMIWLDTIPPWLGEFPEESHKVSYISEYREYDGKPSFTVWKLGGGKFYRLLYADGTEFFMDRQGTQIWATWPASASIEDTATYLLGPVLGDVLRLRGRTLLHGSAIVFNDQAFALVGPPGAGKSTLAAAFAKRGYPVLSEDVLPISKRDSAFVIDSGYPNICLWPTAVKYLFGFSDALPRITPADGASAWWDKRYLDLTKDGYRFPQKSHPLAAIYILGERRDNPMVSFVESLSANDGLMALIANTYGISSLDIAGQAQDLKLLGRVAARVPIRRVSVQEGHDNIPTLCDSILGDFRVITSSSHVMRLF